MNRITRSIGCTMGVLLAISLSGRAQAELITYSFTGTINQPYTDNATLPSSVTYGAAFTGFVTYDTSVANGFSTNPNIGAYDNALVDLQITVGSSTFTLAQVQSEYSTRSNGIFVYYNYAIGTNNYEDSIQAEGGSSDSSNPNDIKQSQLQFSLTDTGANPTALTSTALPTSLSLSSFNQGGGFSYQDNSYNQSTGATISDASFSGTFTSLTPVVPEPSSILLLAIGAGCLLAASRRRISGRPVA